MIYVYGQDLDDRTPASNQLKKELVRAKFKLSELEVLDDPRDISSKGECYILVFGGSAYRELTGEYGISGGRGLMHPCQWSDGALVFPTWATGYLYRNPGMRSLFRDDLANFRFWISFDQKGGILDL